TSVPSRSSRTSTGRRAKARRAGSCSQRGPRRTVVTRDDAPVAATEDERQVVGRASPDGGRGGGRLAKAPVEVGDEGGQEGFDGPEQHELGPPGLEPREGAAIDLHERPARGLRSAAAPSARAGGGRAGRVGPGRSAAAATTPAPASGRAPRGVFR